MKKLKGFFKGKSYSDEPIPSNADTTTVTRLSGSTSHDSSSMLPNLASPQAPPSVHTASIPKSSQDDETAASSNEATTMTKEISLDAARNRLWQRAFEQLKQENPRLAEVYETLIKDDVGADQKAKTFTPEITSAMVQKQKTAMEEKQWVYTWSGKPHKVRDVAENILTTVQKASGIINVGMTAAPPYVSLPWGMVSSLVTFIMGDFEALHGAIDGLKEMTSILASYSYAEREFLANETTSQSFEDAVLELYTAILEYQASAAQYFARSTLKRLGRSTTAVQSWPGAVEKVRRLERLCHTPISALGIRLNQKEFTDIEDMLGRGLKLMGQISSTITSERDKREKIQEWISPINHSRDHADIRDLIGDEYLGSGKWLLEDTKTFGPWKSSPNEILFLQGIVGSGKTSLTSIVIQHLREEGPTAFFYCSSNSSPRDPLGSVHNVTSNIFRSILAQCAVYTDGRIAEPIQHAFDKSDRQSPGGCDMTLRATISTLQQILRDREGEQITFVVDALDECKDQDEFVGCLSELITSNRNLRVFVSTRFGVDLSCFETYRTLDIGSKNSHDIKAYIESEISRRGSNMSPQHADRLKNALAKHSDGV